MELGGASFQITFMPEANSEHGNKMRGVPVRLPGERRAM